MERTEILDMMGELRLFGMRAAYDETLATALKRQHEPQRFIGDLLRAEISEKQARSIKYQLAIAKLPLAKDIDDFAFKDTPINEALVRTLADGGFLAQQRNTVYWVSPSLPRCPGVAGTRWLDDGVVGRGSNGEGLLGEAMKEQPAGL